MTLISKAVRASMDVSEENKLDESELIAQISCVPISTPVNSPLFFPLHQRFDICCRGHHIKRDFPNPSPISAASAYPGEASS